MTNLTPLRLPANITGAQPTGKPDDLRMVRPTFLAPAPTDPKATAHAVGAHVIRLPRSFEARATKIDGAPVLLARAGKAVHVLVDSVGGVVEVIGWSAEQVDAIREWLDVAAVTPENQTELEKLLAKIGERTGGRPIEGKDVTAAEAARLDKLLSLSASTAPMIDNSYVAARATTGDAREVDRLVALAATMDDGATSGDSEVDRLVRLADGLSDG
ncbi:hypothetical protein [Microbacterium trichothecenolyticum]|uniref:Uncharacterized protein n=1 Tax=Microbacterium trichothecenolyticum TaxID=69370 RepID=A0ABU0TZE8_MICTR|nr:hypothetical protein [Microbacterium trichothecenolyticum]MDQ1124890.1 hypothetical protein [Microbacterium trichothecenolyticum]